MATLCKNCGYPLVFDPKGGLLECEACGSSFKAEDIEADEKEFRQDEKVESMEDIYQAQDADFYDCYIYTCSHCGGEIIVNGTEASSTCIYCGNSNVVFSRVSREKKPDVIIPFSISKEDAIKEIHKKIDKGIFIPKEVKNFKPENIRGIYIPYWIMNVKHSDAMLIRSTVKSGKSTTTIYSGRAGSIELKNFPLDASQMLSDESSGRLEPYNLTALKPFDEDYLLGFYSNISDVTFGDLSKAANLRTSEYFNNEVMKDVPGSNKKVVSSNPSTAIDYNSLRYAMLPAWFITFTYKGKHNTILVNGSTGKVVCGLPWNKPLFYSLMMVAGAVFTAISSFPMYASLEFLLNSSSRSSSSSNGNGKIIGVIIAGAIAMMVFGIKKIVKVTKNIERTQSTDIFNFVKKRQG